MLIRKLTIHNIASIADAEIDFQGPQLGDSPIFLICGDTGAGKTTILDSICLALYGDTPRMDNKSSETLKLYTQEEKTQKKLQVYDNRQLLRRGTGEGFVSLTFTANDGLDYEAAWAINRAHNKPDRKFQIPQRTLRTTDGSFSETRGREIKNKIKEICGLDFSQFCRTAMLAQGDFTKFLKSDPKEKSEILEKLTGTEIYSRIGIRIAEKHKQANERYAELQREVKAVELLSDQQKEEISAGLQESVKVAEELDAKRQILVKALEWLNHDFTLSQSLAKRRAEADALSQVIDSDSFKADKLLALQWKESAEGRKIKRELSATDRLVQSDMRLLPELEKAYEKASSRQKEAQQALATAQQNANSLKEEIRLLEPEQNASQLSEVRKSLTLLAQTRGAFNSLEGKRQTLKVLTDNRGVTVKAREEALSKEKGLDYPISLARDNVKMAADNLQLAQLSVAEAVNNLRASLRPGDHCPICNNVIDTVVDSSILTPIVDSLSESLKTANAKLVELESEKKAQGKAVKDKDKEISKLDKAIKTQTEETEKAERELAGFLATAGMVNVSMENAVGEIDLQTERQNQRLAVLEKDHAKIGELRKKIDDATETLSKATNDLITAKDVTSTSLTALETLKTKIQTSTERKVELTKQLDEFHATHPAIDQATLERLDSEMEKDMEALEKNVEGKETEMRDLLVRIEEIKRQTASHQEKRPQLTEEATGEYLKAEESEVNGKLAEAQKNIGKLRETLDQDDRRRKNLENKLKALEEARGQVELWQPLNQKLGDLKGERFRTVAQSFILSSLLQNANRYMTCFNDRYTLTCNPGTLAILVEDCFRPCDPQPVSILSGGESFMTSLALALALADLRSQGMTLDIIFIDEGFGTLSPEYLVKVMDTLEKLHIMGGRRVGLISHVAEMKERIPVHVNVIRESPARSRVQIESDVLAQ